jgi:hypothetical protein
MKKRNRTTVQDLNRLPVTEVGNKSGFQTRKEFYKEQEQITAREQAAAEEKLMAPVRVAEKQFKQAASEHSAKIRSFFSRPASFIVENCENAPVDAYGDYPLLDGARDLQADNSVRQEFKQNLASSGCTLSESGQTRLDVYLDVLNYYRNISLASVTSWAIGLERLNALGCFQPGEISGYDNAVARGEARRPKPAKPEATFDDIASTVSTQSDAGNKALKYAAVDAALTGPIREMWSAFAESLYRNFNGFVFTEKQKCVFHEAMKERRMNWLRPTDYDSVRVALVRSHDLPSHLLYPKEQLLIDMESADLSKPEVRREFNRRERQLSRSA